MERVGLQCIFSAPLCRWEFLSGLTKSQAFSTSCHHLVGVLWCLPGTYRNNTHNSPNPFLVLRLCHSLNAKNQVCHELRFSQGINLSQSFLRVFSALDISTQFLEFSLFLTLSFEKCPYLFLLYFYPQTKLTSLWGPAYIYTNPSPFP